MFLLFDFENKYKCVKSIQAQKNIVNVGAKVL